MENPEVTKKLSQIKEIEEALKELRERYVKIEVDTLIATRVANVQDIEKLAKAKILVIEQTIHLNLSLVLMKAELQAYFAPLEKKDG